MTRSEISQGFLDAIPRLALKDHDYSSRLKDRYICHALRNAECRKIVLDRLGPIQNTYEGWLRSNVEDYPEASRCFRIDEKVQRSRVLWLEALAEEFK